MDFTVMSTDNFTTLSLSPVSQPIQLVISAIYGSIALLSFTFNLATIFVLLKCKICSEVNAYLINLSVSDLIMSCLCIPYTFTTFVLNRWIFPEILCPVANFAQVCSIVVSIWTLTTIGVDRYFATINPLGKRYQMLGIKWRPCHEHKTVALVTIWMLGLSVGLAYSWNFHIVEFQFMNQTLCDCREDLSVVSSRLLTLFLFVFTFGLPLLILVFVYSVIGYQVWCHVTPGNAHQIRDQQSILTREKVIKILILIVVFFFVCWAPLQTFNLLVEFMENFLTYDPNNVLHVQLYVYGYLLVHMLAMSHSFVNPIIYCFSSKNFWKHFCRLFRKNVWFSPDTNYRVGGGGAAHHHHRHPQNNNNPNYNSRDGAGGGGGGGVGVIPNISNSNKSSLNRQQNNNNNNNYNIANIMVDNNIPANNGVSKSRAKSKSRKLKLLKGDKGLGAGDAVSKGGNGRKLESIPLGPVRFSNVHRLMLGGGGGGHATNGISRSPGNGGTQTRDTLYRSPNCVGNNIVVGSYNNNNFHNLSLVNNNNVLLTSSSSSSGAFGSCSGSQGPNMAANNNRLPSPSFGTAQTTNNQTTAQTSRIWLDF